MKMTNLQKPVTSDEASVLIGDLDGVRRDIARRMAFELDRLRVALRQIRESGDNASAGAARMQKIAAWALEPGEWENPE